ncbi:UTRA domain-containing protein [Streptacidiphilus sp. 4-A2]|nr:UTRA domain-containing protein [Streptacidiphilus sp. 4-A2]
MSVDPHTRLHRPEEIDELAGSFADGEQFLGGTLRRDPAAAARLGLPDDEVYEVSTLLRMNGVPCMASRYWLPPRLADLPQDLREGVQGTLLRLGYDCRYRSHTISADLAGPADQDVLGVEPGSAILVREGLLTCEGEPLCHFVRRCRGDLVAFTTRYD